MHNETHAPDTLQRPSPAMDRHHLTSTFPRSFEQRLATLQRAEQKRMDRYGRFGGR
jgi:hypothetical protein